MVAPLPSSPPKRATTDLDDNYPSNGSPIDDHDSPAPDPSPPVDESAEDGVDEESAATVTRKPAWFTEDNHLRISSRTRSKSTSDSTADSSALALIVKTSDSPADARPPPKHHAAAMLEDAIGWTQAEQDEMANHERNNSFTLLTQSDFEKVAPGRRQIRLIWVYARKRSGRLKLSHGRVQFTMAGEGLGTDTQENGQRRGGRLVVPRRGRAVSKVCSPRKWVGDDSARTRR